MIAVAGNHDLPGHNLNRLDESGLGVLEAAEAITLLDEGIQEETPDYTLFGFPWGVDIVPPDLDAGRKVAISHIMTYAGRRLPWPGCTDANSTKLLRQHPEYDLIITGHNHQQFVTEYDGRLLVNAGAVTRQSASDIDLVPKAYIWYAADNSIEEVELPHDKGVVSREHIVRMEERESRISAFAESLSTEGELGLSFEKNLEQTITQNDIKPAVVELVQAAVDRARA